MSRRELEFSKSFLSNLHARFEDRRDFRLKEGSEVDRLYLVQRQDLLGAEERHECCLQQPKLDCVQS